LVKLYLHLSSAQKMQVLFTRCGPTSTQQPATGPQVQLLLQGGSSPARWVRPPRMDDQCNLQAQTTRLPIRLAYHAMHADVIEAKVTHLWHLLRRIYSDARSVTHGLASSHQSQQVLQLALPVSGDHKSEVSCIPILPSFIFLDRPTFTILGSIWQTLFALDI